LKGLFYDGYLFIGLEWFTFMIRTKSILMPEDFYDGVRISVMSRHTLNDGITPHPKISDSSYDLWMPSLAPPAKLIGDYYKRGLSWECFEERYLDYIRGSGVRYGVEALAKKGLSLDLTLLCIEDLPDFCHRRLLAEECRRYENSLVLDLR
jgi:uncharacterized protein YeaO (DUF488 family)